MVEPGELGPHLDAIARALIAYTPEKFTSAFCVAEQADAHGEGRLRYSIGSRDFPDEGTDRPSPELHDAVHGLARLYAKHGSGFPGIELLVSQDGDGWKTKLTMLRPDAQKRGEEAEQQLWKSVYDARAAFFEKAFGPLPEHIGKLMNLTGVWPGGGIFTIEGKDACVTTSFGLSNVDMPTNCSVSNVQQSREGDKQTFSATLASRTPRWAPAERAGYGYEIAIVTRDAAAWAGMPVAWFVQMEILKDVDLLERVNEIGAVTVEAISVGNGMADFLVAPAQAPLPGGTKLPNGDMRLLVATRITRDEMQLALAEGQHTLLERLMKSGVGQTSDLARASILAR